MKARDTVIKLKAVPVQIFKGEQDTIHTKSAYLAGWKDGTEAQAEITWDKAIREVVEWTAREFGVDWSEEKEQLKEWNIKLP